MTSLTSTQHCLDHRALCGPDTLEQWKDIVSGDYTFKIYQCECLCVCVYIYIYIFKTLKKS